MRIHILFPFKDGPWGGANQFLKALRTSLEENGFYTSNIAKADVVIVNSHHSLPEALQWKLSHPEVKFIHRLGPVFGYHRGKPWFFYDREIIRIANLAMDGVAFQSEWSRQEAEKLGFDSSKSVAIIGNAPMNSIFFPKKEHATHPKIRLIATSNSSNWDKGFRYLSHLDSTLDFSKYSLTFVGNSPVSFRNIIHIGPVASIKLGAILRDHDVFISGTRNEACSNALVEALACGLPAVALNDSSNGEVIGKGGVLFQDQADIIHAIDKVACNLPHYQANLPVFSIEVIAKMYIQFGQRLSTNGTTPTNHLAGILHITELRLLRALLETMNRISL